jgi:hypothetical protein
MPFGKHKGKELESIPHDYLIWLLDNAELRSDTLKNEIEKILGINEDAHVGIDREQIKNAMQEWYRELCKQFHPDAGGSHEAMKTVNAAYEKLKFKLLVL